MTDRIEYATTYAVRVGPVDDAPITPPGDSWTLASSAAAFDDERKMHVVYWFWQRVPERGPCKQCGGLARGRDGRCLGQHPGEKKASVVQ